MDKKMSFEDAVKRLEQIVIKLDNQQSSLENSLELFGEGAKLVSHCQKILQKAELKLETLLPEKQEGQQLDE